MIGGLLTLVGLWTAVSMWGGWQVALFVLELVGLR